MSDEHINDVWRAYKLCAPARSASQYIVGNIFDATLELVHSDRGPAKDESLPPWLTFMRDVSEQILAIGIVVWRRDNPPTVVLPGYYLLYRHHETREWTATELGGGSDCGVFVAHPPLRCGTLTSPMATVFPNVAAVSSFLANLAVSDRLSSFPAVYMHEDKHMTAAKTDMMHMTRGHAAASSVLTGASAEASLEESVDRITRMHAMYMGEYRAQADRFSEDTETHSMGTEARSAVVTQPRSCMLQPVITLPATHVIDGHAPRAAPTADVIDHMKELEIAVAHAFGIPVSYITTRGLSNHSEDRLNNCLIAQATMRRHARDVEECVGAAARDVIDEDVQAVLTLMPDPRLTLILNQSGILSDVSPYLSHLSYDPKHLQKPKDAPKKQFNIT